MEGLLSLAKTQGAGNALRGACKVRGTLLPMHVLTCVCMHVGGWMDACVSVAVHVLHEALMLGAGC